MHNKCMGRTRKQATKLASEPAIDWNLAQRAQKANMQASEQQTQQPQQSQQARKQASKHTKQAQRVQQAHGYGIRRSDDDRLRPTAHECVGQGQEKEVVEQRPQKERDREVPLFFFGGDARIRTGDEGFAGPCLTTWPRRRGAAILRACSVHVNVMPAVGIATASSMRYRKTARPGPGGSENSGAGDGI